MGLEIQSTKVNRTFLLSMAQEYILVAACARKRVTGYLVTHFCMVSTAPIGVPTGEACL